MDQATQAAQAAAADGRHRQQRAVDDAHGSVRLEGFTLDPDIEALNQCYVAGELTGDELTAAIKRAIG